MGAWFGLGLCVGQSTVLAVDGRCAELQPGRGPHSKCQPDQPLVRAEHCREIFPYGVRARVGVGLAPAVALRGQCRLQPLSRLAFVLNRVSTRSPCFLVQTEAEIRGLCIKSREVFMSQPILLELEAPIKVGARVPFVVLL